jgi:hypothetical protein
MGGGEGPAYMTTEPELQGVACYAVLDSPFNWFIWRTGLTTAFYGDW